MGYLEEFQTQIEKRNFPKILVLWEEYCTNDEVDAEEFLAILELMKNSDFAESFGKYAEAALSVWQCVQDEEAFFEVLRLIMDLQNTNSPVLADAAYQMLEKKYGNQPEFQERLKLIGLRTRDNFQGALSNYELLHHMRPGKFVFHTAGWGTGEVMEISPLRETVTIEFENAPVLKHINFRNAFKTLIPLKDEHFLARRFGNPDLLEKEGRADPVALVELLLRDLGPKTAAEIKDELCELVIPEEDWTRWWQLARSKLKKHPLVNAPEGLRDPFVLRKKALTHEDRLRDAIHDSMEIQEAIQAMYQLVRDHPSIIKDDEMKKTLHEKLMHLVSLPHVNPEHEFQILLLVEHLLGEEVEGKKLTDRVRAYENVIDVIDAIEVTALKRRAMTLVHEMREDWEKIFLKLFFLTPQTQLRDYIVSELKGNSDLMEALQELLHKPLNHPDLFVWYFLKILTDKGHTLPFGHKEGECLFFEGFLILLSDIEDKPEYKDLQKKMNQHLINNRYALVRQVLEGTSIEFVKEFLLLVAKCHSLTDQDKNIMQSLAAVVHPSLSDKALKDVDMLDGRIIWTTEEGYKKVQERIKEIGTVEMLDVAKEIEKARSYGDLRENSEYKFACERRSRLQGEMKQLSEEIGRARIITKLDVTPDEVGIGSIVDIMDASGKTTTYTILGPWDADVDANILAFQSRLAQSMMGQKVGDHFEFRDEKYQVKGLSNRYS